MALADTAELAVKLTLGGNFQRQLAGVNRSLKNFDRSASRAYTAGQQIGTGIKRGAAIAAAGAGILATQVALGLDSLIQLEKATAQTEAVIKSTGGVAKVTAKDVRTLAERFEALNATIGDETIQEAENLLLTYTNIRKDAFEPTLEAALDMNTALGKGPEGLSNTMRILGKALNDPTKGLGALGRVGITFDKKTTARIKNLQKEGKLYEAQTIILGELEKRFGGSFLAQGGTTAGKVAKFTDSIEDLQRALATALLPAVGNIADALTEFLSDPQTVKDVQQLGDSIGKMFSKENIRNGIDALKDAFGFIKAVAGPIADVVGAAVKAFTSMPPELQKLLVGAFAVNKLTGGLVTNIAGGVFGALKAMTVQAAVVNVNGGMVNGGGGLGGKAGGAAGAAGLGLGGLVLGGAALAGISAAIAEGANKVFATNTNKNPGFQAPQMFNPIPALQNIAAILGVIRDTEKNPPVAKLSKTTNQVLAKVALSNQRNGERNVDSQAQNRAKTTQAIAQNKRETQRGLNIVKATAQRGLDGTKRATDRDATMNVGAQRREGAATRATIRASRPIVNIDIDVSATTVRRSVTVQNRYGGTDSRSSDYSSGAGQFGQ